GKAAEPNPLRGKVRCACCGGKMQRKRGSGQADWYFFICITKNRMGAEHCSGMYVREKPLMDAVQMAAKQYIAEHSDQQMPLLQRQNELQQELKRLAPQVEDPNGYKWAQYERMVEGEISTEEFLQAKERLYCSDERYKNVQNALNGVEKEIERFKRIKSAGAEKIYSEVEAVTVASNDKITVKFR
ncbi:MAG: zinc ribbon domain-containing protein, partial [Christensenellaceae bacterium]